MPYDFLILGGTIVDGSGNNPFPADVGIAGDRIRAVGDLRYARARRRIWAHGLAVAPGFVDIHGHSDVAVIVEPRCLSKVAQGVTTELCGQCGSSPAPLTGARKEEIERAVSFMAADTAWAWESFDQYLTAVEAAGPAMNTVHLAGHVPVRAAVMGFEARRPRADELRQMVRVLEECLDAGAAGFSSGLIYPPSLYGDIEELAELVRACARRGRIYCTHIRSESMGLVESVAEAIETGRRSGARVQIAHHKAAGKSNWGRVHETVAMMERAEAEGVAVGYDVYPYTAGSTSLMSLIAPFAHEGGPERLLQRLREPEWRERIRADIEAGYPSWPGALPMSDIGFENVVIAHVDGQDVLQATGKSLQQVADEHGMSSVDVIFELLLRHNGMVSHISHSMCEEDVAFLLQHRLGVVSSDASVRAPDGPLSKGRPHPRAYGASARVLGRYVRERGILSLAEAVRKMTSEPAGRIGLARRGLVRSGYFADLVIFDPQAVTDRATYDDPHQLATGVPYVMVNGQLTIDNGTYTGASAGRVLRL